MKDSETEGEVLDCGKYTEAQLHCTHNVQAVVATKISCSAKCPAQIIAETIN